VSHIYQVFLRILFFVTPIFYAPSYIDNDYARYIIVINPLAHFIEFSRSALMEGTPFPADTFTLFLGLNAVAIAAALGVFRTYESKFAEYV
jgi:ABC-type polysaccharide/polyol phosphate export permease